MVRPESFSQVELGEANDEDKAILVGNRYTWHAAWACTVLG
jgi:hypothetical protein